MTATAAPAARASTERVLETTQLVKAFGGLGLHPLQGP
jgi:hypothetical protein